MSVSEIQLAVLLQVVLPPPPPVQYQAGSIGTLIPVAVYTSPVTDAVGLLMIATVANVVAGWLP